MHMPILSTRKWYCFPLRAVGHSEDSEGQPRSMANNFLCRSNLLACPRPYTKELLLCFHVQCRGWHCDFFSASERKKHWGGGHIIVVLSKGSKILWAPHFPTVIGNVPIVFLNHSHVAVATARWVWPGESWGPFHHSSLWDLRWPTGLACLSLSI